MLNDNQLRGLPRDIDLLITAARQVTRCQDPKKLSNRFSHLEAILDRVEPQYKEIMAKKPVKKTMNNIVAGEIVNIDDTEGPSRALFLGFSDIVEKYSETPRFDTLKEAKENFGVKRNVDLEAVGEKIGYGHSVYAIFKCLETGMVFRSYLFEGKWCICSGAHPLRFC